MKKVMKRDYVEPSVVTAEMELGRLMLESSNGNTVESDKDIDYGGTDEEGQKDPSARQSYHSYDAWEDEEDVENV